MNEGNGNGKSGIDVNKFLYNAQQKQNPNQNKDKISNNDSIRESFKAAKTKIQQILSENHATELAGMLDDSKMEKSIKNLISKYLQDDKITIAGIEFDELVTKIYDDMVGLGCLKDFIYDSFADLNKDEYIEEINGNSFNDIEVVTNLRNWKLPKDHTFFDALEAQTMIKKLCAIGGKQLDDKTPGVDSEFMKGVRISAAIPPIIDEDKGVCFSIRKQRNIVPTKKQLLDWDTATEEELDFIMFLIKHKIPVVFVGGTGSGKTTDITYYSSNIPDDMRVCTAEDQREINLIKCNEDGSIKNRVVQFKTRQNFKDEERNVDYKSLLKLILRFHPDIIILGEMRGEEAVDVMDAFITGHGGLSSFHGEGGADAYQRIFAMCKKSKVQLSDELLMRQIVKAFPIVVYKKQCLDKRRRYMSITEAEEYINGKIRGRYLYKFKTLDNKFSDDGTRIEKVVGTHKLVKKISNKLADRLLENGATLDEVRLYAGPDWDPNTDHDGSDYL